MRRRLRLGSLRPMPDERVSVDPRSFQERIAAMRESERPEEWGARFLGFDLSGEALDRLRSPSAMSSTALLEAHDRADWQHTPPDFQVFGALLIEEFRRKAVPLYVAHVDDARLRLAHLSFGAMFAKDELTLLDRAAHRICAKYKFMVGPDGPASWRFYGERRRLSCQPGEPLRLTPRRILSMYRPE